jgi:hypothetical protein
MTPPSTNMSLIDSDLQNGLDYMESLQDDPTFSWAGLTWPCTKNTLKTGAAFEIGGATVIFDFAIRVRLDALDSTKAQKFTQVQQPVKGNLITVAGAQYRIEFVDRAHAAFLTLLLTSDAK